MSASDTAAAAGPWMEIKFPAWTVNSTILNYNLCSKKIILNDGSNPQPAPRVHLWLCSHYFASRGKGQL